MNDGKEPVQNDILRIFRHILPEKIIREEAIQTGLK
jgi:hypothetical protein